MALSLLPLSNPRRRSHRRRRNPGYADNPRRYSRRRNPSLGGVDAADTAGVLGGMVGAAYVDSALVGPLATNFGGGMAGGFKPVLTALLSALALHVGMTKVSRPWARKMAPGAAAYAGVAVVNTFAPGTLPITIGVPQALGSFKPFAAFQPPAPAAALPAAAAATAPDYRVATSLRTPMGL